MAEKINNAAVIGRIVLSGKIELKSPLLIGDGVGDESYDSTKDIHVLKNKQQVPFIPATSLCGVMREYMYSMTGEDKRAAEILFGNASDDNGQQSLLQLDDIILTNAEISDRDGVKIDSFTGTAVKGAKFDYEVVERGAKGKLMLTLQLRESNRADKELIRKAFIRLRSRLEQGISVGAKTAVGFGKLQLTEQKSGYYDFSKINDVEKILLDYSNVPSNADDKITEKLDIDIVEPDRLVIDADFAMKSAMLIRDTEVSDSDKKENISAVFKKSKNAYVIPGSSLKGVLRAHSEFILNRLAVENNSAKEFINSLMGYADDDANKAKSRFFVEETYINADEAESKVKAFAQPRTRIDRFTGGVIRSALFKTKPIWQKKTGEKTIHLHFEIKNATEAEAGMAMLLLRDLWQGKVAIGGEKSIGRGTLSGISAKVHYLTDYELGEKGKLLKGSAEKLEGYTRALKNYTADITKNAGQGAK